MGHAYNMIKINNQWYSLDATYEINRFLGGKILENRFKDNFFLKQGSINRSRIGNFSDLSDCDAPEDMPRENINEVKNYLESKGVSFNYNSSDIVLESGCLISCSNFKNCCKVSSFGFNFLYN